MSNNLVEMFDEYYKDKEYIVEDIVSSNESNIVFILESPHNDELGCHPVAGPSGIYMAKFMEIGNGEESLGYIAKEKNDLNLSIINVSKVPLQKTKRLDKKYEGLLSELNKLRKYYESFGNHKKDTVLNDIEEKILADFKNRVNRLKYNNKTLFVVCGKFAEVYFEKIELDSDNRINVPHPSRGKWNINCDHDGLLQLKEKFNARL